MTSCWDVLFVTVEFTSWSIRSSKAAMACVWFDGFCISHKNKISSKSIENTLPFSVTSCSVAAYAAGTDTTINSMAAKRTILME